jgi:hypothetical protein
MNYKAYDELRFFGHSPEEAMALAETYEPVDIYEQKTERGLPSHGKYPVRAIGLKEEFKQKEPAL